MSATQSMTEQQLTDAVLELARVLQWRTIHLRPARTADGWRTPVQGDGVGWPDLFAVRNGRLIAAELKSRRGTVTTAQRQWLDVLAGAGVSTFVWRPADWLDGTIEAVLRNKTTTPASPATTTPRRRRCRCGVVHRPGERCRQTVSDRANRR